jgi:hypothetical protein
MKNKEENDDYSNEIVRMMEIKKMLQIPRSLSAHDFLYSFHSNH